jgi:Xaa-Pro aminopeptidase
MKINLFLESHELDCIIVPSGDEFLSEYCYNSLLYLLTGFSGSNGIGILTKNTNIFLTDSRYLIQAKNELKSDKWEIKNLQNNSIFTEIIKYDKIGIIGDYISHEMYEKICKIKPIKLINSSEIFTQFNLQKNTEKNTVINFEKYQEKSHIEKIKNINLFTNNRPLIITDSSSICWLLNIRGFDVKYSLLLNCFAILIKEKIYLFSNAIFEKENVEFLPFYEFENFIKNIKEINVDKSEINADLYKKISEKCTIFSIKNPIKNIKIIKNNLEINAFKKCHEIDAISVNNLIDFIKEKTELITEFNIKEKALELRKNNSEFISESFDTISGFNENSAIVHYSAKKETAKIIENDGILLIDSGGHYFSGTTDITRTIAVGNPEAKFPEIKKHYTIVLKSLIMLSNLHFPIRTNGVQLDGIARYNLWQNGLDFGHGTGHGVGFALSVHEGPCGISKSRSSYETEIQEGMILSIEPGVYFDGKYGIRLENLALVKKSTKFANFFEFETLTKAKFDRSLVDFSLISEEELKNIDF